MSNDLTHEEYCGGFDLEFVINYTFDVSIDGDGGKSIPPLTVPRTFTDGTEAIRVARRMQRLGNGLLQGIGVLHNHPECEGILCLNKLDELGEEWEEDHLCTPNR
tara:strand:+ start:762 stop:1076 length:315 start_codon:yes stop_codon:yes gene_type:complete